MGVTLVTFDPNTRHAKSMYSNKKYGTQGTGEFYISLRKHLAEQDLLDEEGGYLDRGQVRSRRRKRRKKKVKPYSGKYWTKQLLGITDQLDVLEKQKCDKKEEILDLKDWIRKSMKSTKAQHLFLLPDERKLVHYCDGLALTAEDIEYLNSNEHIKQTVEMIHSQQKTMRK